MEILIWTIILGIIPALIAHNKGKPFLLWWAYGALLFIVALPHSIITKADREYLERQQIADGMKKCPYCAEMIKNDAVICKHCGQQVEKQE
jgi:hypothetical protein